MPHAEVTRDRVGVDLSCRFPTVRAAAPCRLRHQGPVFQEARARRYNARSWAVGRVPLGLGMPSKFEHVALLFLIPFLSELKISWAFAAAPLHFQRNGFPLWAFGATLSVATLLRVPMNALLTVAGDWLIAPILALGAACAACMLAEPTTLWAVVVGIAAGHATDTAQVQASLCYRWQEDNPPAQKRGLRLQAFSATFGYSSGALLGGALYEHSGFLGCAVLQVAILGGMTVTAALLPVVHASCRQSCRPDRVPRVPSRPAAAAAAPEVTVSPADPSPPPLTICATTRCLLLPASLLWLCDGFNIGCYICEWALFAVYFSDAFGWSSTLTGAAQMAGDMLAAAILALTTTSVWARLVRHNGATRQVERLLLRPPWNLGLFFGAYSVTFWMLAQPAFGLSVLGQVLMGTVCTPRLALTLPCLASPCPRLALTLPCLALPCLALPCL